MTPPLPAKNGHGSPLLHQLSQRRRTGVDALCPHCRLWHDGRIVRMCPDRERWTQEERDVLHARLKANGVHFGISTAEFARRFGGR